MNHTEEAVSLLREQGYQVHQPETQEDKYDRYFEDLIRCASVCESLQMAGVKLPPRDYLSYSIALLIRVAKGVEEQT